MFMFILLTVNIIIDPCQLRSEKCPKFILKNDLKYLVVSICQITDYMKHVDKFIINDRKYEVYKYPVWIDILL